MRLPKWIQTPMDGLWGFPLQESVLVAASCCFRLIPPENDTLKHSNVCMYVYIYKYIFTRPLQKYYINPNESARSFGGFTICSI